MGHLNIQEKQVEENSETEVSQEYPKSTTYGEIII